MREKKREREYESRRAEVASIMDKNKETKLQSTKHHKAEQSALLLCFLSLQEREKERESESHLDNVDSKTL